MPIATRFGLVYQVMMVGVSHSYLLTPSAHCNVKLRRVSGLMSAKNPRAGLERVCIVKDSSCTDVSIHVHKRINELRVCVYVHVRVCMPMRVRGMRACVRTFACSCGCLRIVFQDGRLMSVVLLWEPASMTELLTSAVLQFEALWNTSICQL
jgi:hypothetical protein